MTIESVSAVVAAFNKLYDINIPVKMVAHEKVGRLSPDGAWGAAQFKNGKRIAIWVSDELPYCGVADVLAHEFAHIVVGIEHGHDATFTNCYRRIKRWAKKIEKGA